jgi:hypothetical protein
LWRRRGQAQPPSRLPCASRHGYFDGPGGQLEIIQTEFGIYPLGASSPEAHCSTDSDEDASCTRVKSVLKPHRQGNRAAAERRQAGRMLNARRLQHCHAHGGVRVTTEQLVVPVLRRVWVDKSRRSRASTSGRQ